MDSFSDRYEPQIPLLTSGIVGFVSFAGFAVLPSLSPSADRTGVVLLVAAMGIGQVGAIVSSLALVGQAVVEPSTDPTMRTSGQHILNRAVAANPTVPDQPSGRGRLAIVR